MLNLKNIKKIYDNPEIKHRIISRVGKEKENKRKSNKYTVEKILKVIKTHKGVNKKLLTEKTGCRHDTLIYCLEDLIEKKLIKAELIGTTGMHPIFSYSAIA